MQYRLLRSLAMLLAAVPFLAFAQGEPEIEKESRHKLTRKADDYFEAKEYFVASEIYKKAYSKEKSTEQKQRISFNMAECYRYTGQCKRAESYYVRAYKLDYGPLALLNAAEMIQCQGNYEDAIASYTEYQQLVPDDPRAAQGIEACQSAAKWEVEGSLFSVDNAKALNSKKSDYAIAYAGKRGKEDLTLIVSSMRDESKGKKEDGWMGQRFSDLFIIEGERQRGKRKKGKEADANDEVKWGELESLSDVINTKDHEGVVAFDSRMKTMYFTRCMKVKNVKMGCGIYTTRQVGQDWANPEPVVMALDSGSSVGHPALSLDDNILYFAGELPGGKGGRDIYMTTYNRRNRAWEAPTSLSINTRGDELYPYVHGDGYLYFSSNGHVGMGGLDVFRVKLDDNGMPVGDVENMKSPINSEADDIALRWLPGDNTLKGFIVSDRKGTRGAHDIWHVTEWQKDFHVKGIVRSTKDGSPIKNATIEVSDKDGNSFEVTSDDKGMFEVERGSLLENTKYKLNLSKKKYLNAVGDITTEGLALTDYSRIKEERVFLKEFNLELSMDPIEIPIVLPNVFFDFARAELRNESKVALDTVYNILQRNPNITIGLRSHTDYRGGTDDNNDLSQRRADSCVAYLIKKGVPQDRLTAQGMGESDPFVIPMDYSGYGAGMFASGTRLSEDFIKGLNKEQQEVANQINRRTDFMVLRDDYVPAETQDTESVGEKSDTKKNKKPIGETIVLEPGQTSLGAIAKKYKMNVVQLKKLNGGMRGARPVPGMVLKVTLNGDYTEFDATHHQVKPGDKIKSIASKYNLKPKDLKGLNEDLSKDTDLIVGSYVRIQ